MLKRFRADRACSLYAQLMQLAERASRLPPDSEAPPEMYDFTEVPLANGREIASNLGLPETTDHILRLLKWEQGITCKEVHFGFMHLMELMQSELKKRKVVAIDPEMNKHYRDEIFGVKVPSSEEVALLERKGVEKPEPVFGEKTESAFPSAYMDIIEAGRCLALARNNAAIYHLMQVAEMGLRALARDRRITIERGKKKTVVPLTFAQWGEIIGELTKKREKINQWPRSKEIRERAIEYYAYAIFEVSSFNDIYRKHISHARGKLYEDDTAIACWGHVKRFMGALAERSITETTITPAIWPKN